MKEIRPRNSRLLDSVLNDKIYYINMKGTLSRRSLVNHVEGASANMELSSIVLYDAKFIQNISSIRYDFTLFSCCGKVHFSRTECNVVLVLSCIVYCTIGYF